MPQVSFAWPKIIVSWLFYVSHEREDEKEKRREEEEEEEKKKGELMTYQLC